MPKLVSTLQRLKAPFAGILIWIVIIALIINAFLTITPQNCADNKTRGITILIAITSLVFIYFKAIHNHIWPKRSSKFTGFSAANEMRRLAEMSKKRMKTIEEAIEYWLSIIEKAEDNLDQYEEEYKDMDIARKVTMVRTGLAERGRSISHEIKTIERSKSMDTPYSYASIYAATNIDSEDAIRNNQVFKQDIEEPNQIPVVIKRRNATTEDIRESLFADYDIVEQKIINEKQVPNNETPTLVEDESFVVKTKETPTLNNDKAKEISWDL